MFDHMHLEGQKKNMMGIQCDQIGQFLKDLGYKFSLKRSPNVW